MRPEKRAENGAWLCCVIAQAVRHEEGRAWRGQTDGIRLEQGQKNGFDDVNLRGKWHVQGACEIVGAREKSSARLGAFSEGPIAASFGYRRRSGDTACPRGRECRACRVMEKNHERMRAGVAQRHRGLFASSSWTS